LEIENEPGCDKMVGHKRCRALIGYKRSRALVGSASVSWMKIGTGGGRKEVLKISGCIRQAWMGLSCRLRMGHGHVEDQCEGKDKVAMTVSRLASELFGVLLSHSTPDKTKKKIMGPCK
jgi:hypothetical protein